MVIRNEQIRAMEAQQFHRILMPLAREDLLILESEKDDRTLLGEIKEADIKGLELGLTTLEGRAQFVCLCLSMSEDFSNDPRFLNFIKNTGNTPDKNLEDFVEQLSQATSEPEPEILASELFDWLF